MNPFKRIAKLEDRITGMALELVRATEKLEEIEKKLPEYDEAVARGVDTVWNKAVQSVIDYNPFVKVNENGDNK